MRFSSIKYMKIPNVKSWDLSGASVVGVPLIGLMLYVYYSLLTQNLQKCRSSVRINVSLVSAHFLMFFFLIAPNCLQVLLVKCCDAEAILTLTEKCIHKYTDDEQTNEGKQ